VSDSAGLRVTADCSTCADFQATSAGSGNASCQKLQTCTRHLSASTWIKSPRTVPNSACLLAVSDCSTFANSRAISVGSSCLLEGQCTASESADLHVATIR
jgi:hypothetical protein